MAGLACLGLDALQYAATRITGGSTDAYRNWLEGVDDIDAQSWVKVSVTSLTSSVGRSSHISSPQSFPWRTVHLQSQGMARQWCYCARAVQVWGREASRFAGYATPRM